MNVMMVMMMMMMMMMSRMRKRWRRTVSVKYNIERQGYRYFLISYGYKNNNKQEAPLGLLYPKSQPQ